MDRDERLQRSVRGTPRCIRFIGVQNPDNVKFREVETQRQSLINIQYVSREGEEEFFFMNRRWATNIQQTIEETQSSGSTVVRDVLRVRKLKKKKKNKKKLKTKKKKVLRRMFFYDSYDGSEKRVLDYEDPFVAMGYCSDSDKFM